jgi:hypothetical protein
MKQKVNLSGVHPSKVFYGYLYPLFARPFLFGSNYQEFAEMVSMEFKLTPQQWEAVLQEWELKETILAD